MNISPKCIQCQKELTKDDYYDESDTHFNQITVCEICKYKRNNLRTYCIRDKDINVKDSFARAYVDTGKRLKRVEPKYIAHLVAGRYYLVLCDDFTQVIISGRMIRI